MLTNRKTESFLKKKTVPQNPASEDTVQSLRSWIRKIEQSTTSVSARLTAVEKRLSGGMTEIETGPPLSMQGPVETLVRNGKKRNAGELAHLLDSELTLLHNELVQKEPEVQDLKNQLLVVDGKHARLSHDVHAVQSFISQIEEKIRLKMERLERREPLVMRLGTMEVPIEFTGIIGGLLAFTVAILVVLDQKAVLLSPVFLFIVGILLIGSAMLKMIRTHTRTTMRPSYAMPLTTRSTSITPLQYEQKEG
jgi:hypothetical protein